MCSFNVSHKQTILKIIPLAVLCAMAQTHALADTTISTATTTPLTLSSGNLTITDSGSVTNLPDDTVYTSGAFNTINNAGTLNSGVHAIHLGASTNAIVNSGSIEAAGIGIYNAGGTLGSLTNTGLITGNGTPGAGIDNFGTITSITNSGVISGNKYAINNGPSATLGAITNSGSLQGNIVNLSSNDLTINGDNSGTTGTLTGYNGTIGTITNTHSNLVFGSGSQLLNDNINVGSHSVTNTAATLKINHPIAITGNYSQASGATLQIGVASMADYGKLSVSGNATLGGNLFVDAASANGLSAGTLSSVINASSISGNFASVTDNSTLFNFTAYNNCTDVSLKVTAGDTGVYDAVKATSNTPARGAAQVLDKVIVSNPTSAIALLFQPLSSQQAVSNAVSQTLPVLTGASVHATQTALFSITQVIQSRQDSTSHGLSSGDDFYGNQQFWLKPFGSWANQDDKGGVSGYTAHTGGLALGVDTDVSPSQRIGFAFAYGATNVTGNSSVAAQSDAIKVYQLSAYGSHDLDANTEVTYRAGIGQNHNDAKRSLSFASGEATASYNSLSASLGAGLARTYPLSEKTSFTPSVHADYTWIKEDGYQESGSSSISPLLLNVGSRSADELILAVDGKLNHQLQDEQTSLFANLGVGYDALNKQTSITSSYAGAPTANFVTYGLDTSPWLARGGFGITHRVKNGVELSARYDVEYRASYLNQTASVKAKWAF